MLTVNIRYIDEAAFGDPGAEAAWRDFQGYINASKAAIGGMGVFIDLHGQVHREQVTGSLIVTYHSEQAYNIMFTNVKCGSHSLHDKFD